MILNSRTVGGLTVYCSPHGVYTLQVVLVHCISIIQNNTVNDIEQSDSRRVDCVLFEFVRHMIYTCIAGGHSTSITQNHTVNDIKQSASRRIDCVLFTTRYSFCRLSYKTSIIQNHTVNGIEQSDSRRIGRIMFEFVHHMIYIAGWL